MSARNSRAVGLVGLLVVGVALVIGISQARAGVPGPLASVKAFQVTCATTATPIIPPSGDVIIGSQRLWNASATAVFLGGSDVNTTTLGYPICTTSVTCAEDRVSLDARAVVFCRVAASTQVITVLAGRP